MKWEDVSLRLQSDLLKFKEVYIPKDASGFIRSSEGTPNDPASGKSKQVFSVSGWLKIGALLPFNISDIGRSNELYLRIVQVFRLHHISATEISSLKVLDFAILLLRGSGKIKTKMK
jgi:hypothetical protein